MDKVTRVQAVLSGGTPDRPPVCLWYHHGLQHVTGDQLAPVVTDYFDHYQFDWLKVMNDYRYPMPEGTGEIATAEGLRQLASFDITATDWRHQLSALRRIAAHLHGDALFVDTIFDPWTTLRRLCGQHLPALVQQSGPDLHRALATITENLIDYARAALSTGAAGIFLSIPAGTDGISQQEFQEFVRPYDLQLLAAVADAPMNIAHVHGNPLHFDEVMDFPVAVFNWHDRSSDNPGLAEIRERSGRCVMGGIDHLAMGQMTIPAWRRHVAEGMASGGASFFLAGGCSIATETDPAYIRETVQVAAEAGR